MRKMSRLVLARARCRDTSAQVRRAFGIRRCDMASALGVREASLARWERGVGRPPPDVAELWAHILRQLEE